MRGSIIRRSKGKKLYTLVLDLGPDPETGKRRQKWISHRGDRRSAETRLNELMTEASGGTFVDATKITVGTYLGEWLAAYKAQLRPNSYTRYKGIIDNNLLPSSIAKLPLQRLRPTHIEAYYSEALAAGTSASTLNLHHCVLHRALGRAVRDRLISTNPAANLEGRPRRSRGKSEDARIHCWSAGEAKAFLKAATEAGAQPAALYTLAIDSGMRKGELCGLRWEDVDLDAAKVRVVQQLLSAAVGDGGKLVVGPTKSGAVRTITISSDTAALLRAHRKAQRELMMQHRDTYRDFGLVFAREDGHPLPMNNMGQREYARLIEAAKVRPIKFHGLRHTCATLLLQSGQPVHVVSERLGHSKVSMTMEVYAHVLPDMQADAARAIGEILS